MHDISLKRCYLKFKTYLQHVSTRYESSSGKIYIKQTRIKRKAKLILKNILKRSSEISMLSSMQQHKMQDVDYRLYSRCRYAVARNYDRSVSAM